MLFRRFWGDRKGNIAPMLAVAMVPIVGAVSAAVDYSRASAARTGMQAALDATALMLSKGAETLPVDEISRQATAYFKANYTNPNAENVAVASALSSPQDGSYVLDLTGSATVPTSFTRVLGQKEIAIKAHSEVVWGIRKLNLALALDNTGSMAQSGKMAALQQAAHNLLSTLQAAAKKPGDVLVSIVPFATDVDIGTGNIDADWVDWTDWEARNGSRVRTCTGSGWSQECTTTWVPNSHSTWNGCVYDRDQNNDVMNTATLAGTPATMYRAHQASGCPTAMMPLSEDWTALNSKIDAMAPAGNTNVTIGLQMAWQTLTAAAPFNAPEDAADRDKVIVLLTDGENTQNRWSTSATSIDARTAKVCADAKAANITVYTVRVIDGNASLLQSCATKPSMYFDVQQADQLNAVFTTIAQNLAKLRLAK